MLALIWVAPTGLAYGIALIVAAAVVVVVVTVLPAGAVWPGNNWIMPDLEATVTVMPALGVSTTPTQLVARVFIVCGPSAGSVQAYVQLNP